jgi:hypothetical protein
MQAGCPRWLEKMISGSLPTKNASAPAARVTYAEGVRAHFCHRKMRPRLPVIKKGTRRLAPVVDLVFAAKGVRCRLEIPLEWAEQC